MKFLVLSNTITNGGDFLIVNSGIRLINEYFGPNSFDYCNIHNTDIQKIDMKEYEFIIYIGGPLYIDRLLESVLIPIVNQIKDAKKKLFVLGSGWYGQSDCSEVKYNYRFSEKSREVLDYIDENGILGCRDDLTVNILKNNGYNNAIMTGCPVWYDEQRTEYPSETTIRRIAVSDIGMTKEKEFQCEKLSQFKQVFWQIQSKFRDTELIFTFNNGINTKYSAEFNNNVKEFLQENNISYYDLSGGDELFEVYDNCDLHIGYRVHSHLYCLSRGIPSVLICEDARGIGMNRTLGFPVIRANALDKDGYKNNPYLLNELEYEIERLLKHKDFEMDRVRNLIRHHYEMDVKEFFNRVRNE